MQATSEELVNIPQHLTKRAEMREFLLELRKGVEEWRALKLVVLGHGRIGKSTLVQALKDIIQVDSTAKVLFL